jgi:hypothetical protein
MRRKNKRIAAGLWGIAVTFFTLWLQQFFDPHSAWPLILAIIFALPALYMVREDWLPVVSRIWHREYTFLGKLDSRTGERHPAELAREGLAFLTFIVPDHIEDTLIGGIKWRKDYTDVRLYITNNKAFDLENVDFRVKFDTEIAQAAQISEVPDVNLLPVSADPPWLVHSSVKYKDASGKDVEKDQAFEAMAVPAYRILCKRLLRGHPLQIVFATASLHSEESGLVTSIDRFADPKKRPTVTEISGRFEIADDGGSRTRHDIGIGTAPL